MENKTSHILVPCNLTEQSNIALSQTYNLARFTHTEITLLYVIEEDNVGRLFFGAKAKNEETLLKLKVKEELERIAKSAQKEAGVKVSVRVESGKVHEQIVKVAQEINAIFIVMAKNTSEGIAKYIGSNTFRIVSEAPCPVITIRGSNHNEGCKLIVLPLDLSKETKEKVSKAIEIARYFGSEIRIVMIEESDDEFLKKKLQLQLAQVKNFISDRGVKCSTDSVPGNNVSEAICSYAEKENADLIIIMTQEEIGWTEYLVGTVAQKIILGTEIPIMSIKPTEKSDTTSFVPY